MPALPRAGTVGPGPHSALGPRGCRLATSARFAVPSHTPPHTYTPCQYARRIFKTPAGQDYYFDPATERIHYLSATGCNNYAIDPLRNTAVGYDTLRQLEARLAAGGAGEADAESDEEVEGESAPLSTSKDTANAAQKGFKLAVQAAGKVAAAKRVRVAAEGAGGSGEVPPLPGVRGFVVEQTV